MGQHRRAVNSSDRVRAKAGGVLLAGSLLGATAIGAVNEAPTANATCFSAFGIGNGNGCTSNITSIAIGIGEGATADASFGLLGGAVAIGTGASAANAISAFTGALALGDHAKSAAMFSIFSMLAQFGPGTTAVIGGPNIAIGASAGGPSQTSVLGGFNIAAQLGPGSTNALGGLNLALGVSPGGTGEQKTVAGLFATFALNLIGNSNASAQGFLAAAVNVLGQQLWPIKLVVDLIAAVFPGPVLAPAAPEPVASLFAMKSSEFSEQGAQDTALADVNSRVENAATARNVAPVPTGDLQPAEAPAEIEVFDKSMDFAVKNEDGGPAGTETGATGTSGTTTGATGTSGTTTGATGTSGTTTGATGTSGTTTGATGTSGTTTGATGTSGTTTGATGTSGTTTGATGTSGTTGTATGSTGTSGTTGTATGSTGTSGTAEKNASPGGTNTGDDHAKDSSDSEKASK